MKGSSYRYLVTGHTCSVWRFWGFGFAKSHMLVERFSVHGFVASQFYCVFVLSEQGFSFSTKSGED